MWSKQGTSRGSSFAEFKDDNYYYTGGMLQPGTSFDTRELYISKWSFDGTLVWAKQIDDTLTIQTNNIVVDKQGNVYACGSTRGSGTIGGPDILSLNDISKLALTSLNKPIKIMHLPDWIRRFTIWTLRTFTSVKTYGPIEFFLTLMAEDNIAPTYGEYHLKDYFREEANTLKR